MGRDIYNWVREKWNVSIGKRLTMLSSPNLYVKKKHVYEYQKEICRRSMIPMHDIDALSQPIEDNLFFANTINSAESLFYGDLHALLDYSGLQLLTMPPLNLGLQHGYVFEIRDWEKSKLNKRNIVWSRALVDMYRQYTDNPDVYAVGAAFFYAKSLFDNNTITEEKRRLGKNLLAFPMHSQTHVDTNYDPNKFLNILLEERKRFDTVRVCMYWKDILRGSHKVFEDAGFECVCNGHLFDPNFLRRQKTLFELADATISNGVGSHIGYSLFMGKPHCLIDDEYEYVNIKKGGDAKDLTEVEGTENFKKVKNAFLNNTEYNITQQQRAVVDEFWGISDMKSPEELKKMFLKLYGCV